MPDFSDARAFVMDGEITVADDSPLHRARAISRLIDEEALASERLGRLTDRVAAALLEANLCSIRVPQADGGLGGTCVDLLRQRRKSSAPTGPPAGAWGSATLSTHSFTRARRPRPAKKRSEMVPSAARRRRCPKPLQSKSKTGFASRAASAGGRAVHSHAR